MTPSEPLRFLVDHMVVKLGVYLRILGHDAVGADPALRTQDLIGLANRDGRIFLTRNRHLADRYPAPRRCLVVRSPDPVTQLREVIAAFGLDPTARLFSRCIRCNVALVVVPDKNDVRGRVHPNVWSRYGVFYRCPRCDTVFWKGSHVRNTCRKLGLPYPSETAGDEATGRGTTAPNVRPA